MTKQEIKDALYPGCPIRNVLSRIGDKWSMLVLTTLSRHGVLRFSGLRLHIPDISHRMLSAALKTLEADGLVQRTVYPEVPPRVEYRLTQRGQTLIPLIELLIEWAVSNTDNIMKERYGILLEWNSAYVIVSLCNIIYRFSLQHDLR